LKLDACTYILILFLNKKRNELSLQSDIDAFYYKNINKHFFRTYALYKVGPSVHFSLQIIEFS